MIEILRMSVYRAINSNMSSRAKILRHGDEPCHADSLFLNVILHTNRLVRCVFLAQAMFHVMSDETELLNRIGQSLVPQRSMRTRSREDLYGVL